MRVGGADAQVGQDLVEDGGVKGGGIEVGAWRGAVCVDVCAWVRGAAADEVRRVRAHVPGAAGRAGEVIRTRVRHYDYSCILS